MTEDNNLGLEFKYLIVNDMDRKFGLWVNTVGYQSIPPDSPYPLKEHPSGYYFNAEKGRVLREYQLVYITKGRGLFSSDSTPERQVCKGRLMVLFPGQGHTYYPLRQTGWTEYYIGFEGPAIDTIVGDAFLSQERQILEVVERSFAAGYGTVLFFEDTNVVRDLQQKFPGYAGNFPVWSEQTSAMHQLAIWTMLEDAGFGASLQHYNPLIDNEVRKRWSLPEEWRLIAQMPFGTPAGEPGEKTFKPLDERIRVFR